MQIKNPWSLAAALSTIALVAQAGAVPVKKPAPGHAPPKAHLVVHQQQPAGPKANVESYTPERYRPLVMLKARNEFEAAHGYRFDKIIRGDGHKKQIALTFDDGPHQAYTLQLLNVLKEMHTPATFFVVGRQVEKFPELLKKEAAEGFEIGNHTYDHIDLTQIPPELISYELDQCDFVIKRTTGKSVRFFRPPGGNYDHNVIREAVRRKYVTALWTDDPADYARPPAHVILKRSLDRLENGAIILLHDGIPETIEILPELITEARRRGYEFVLMSTLTESRKNINQIEVAPTIKHGGAHSQAGL